MSTAPALRDNDLALLERIAAGGGWPEGMIYDWIANWPRVKALEAWRTATGEDLFASTACYRERLGYLLLHRWPGLPTNTASVSSLPVDRRHRAQPGQHCQLRADHWR